MSVPARYPYARVKTDEGSLTIALEKVGPAFVSGRMSCGVGLRAPLPQVELVSILDLTDDERVRFRLPERAAA